MKSLIPIFPFFISCLLINSQGDSQTAINLRIESGYNINFSSYRPSIFVQNNIFKPWPKDFYYLLKLNDYTYSPNIGFGIEGEIGNHHNLQIGCSFNEKYELRFIYNLCLPINIVPDTINYTRIGTTFDGLMSLYFTKIGAIYSYEKHRSVYVDGYHLSLSPLVGVNAFLSKWYDGQHIYSSTGYFISTNSYGKIDTLASVGIDSWIENANSAWTILGGIDLSLMKDNSDIINLRIYYEQGFKEIQRDQFTFISNNRKYIENLYLFGSGLHFQLSFPIRIVRFSKGRIQKSKI